MVKKNFLIKTISLILVSCISLTTFTGCGKQQVAVEEEEEEEFSGSLVDYKSNMKWMLINTNEMKEDSLKYYSIKILMTTKVEQLVLEDAYLKGYTIDKDNTTFEDYISNKANEGCDAYDFYFAMKTSEEELTNYVYNYLKKYYPDTVKSINCSDAEEFFSNYSKNYYSEINSFDSNPHLKNEIIEYLSTFKITENGWIKYKLKDKYTYHLEILKQFIPEGYKIKSDSGYCLVCVNNDNSKDVYTFIQDVKTGEIYRINSEIRVTDLNTLVNFDIGPYLNPNKNEHAEKEEWTDGIANRESEDGIYYADIYDKFEPDEVNNEIMEAWDKFGAYVREDSCNSTELNITKLIANGYVHEKIPGVGWALIKRDNDTGKCHIIHLKDRTDKSK